jgi:dipeptidyl aminopeptidase/acylaminoacyl peptidase
MKPTGYAEGDECPLILKIHGGPHGAYGHTFNHHFQLLAGEGYAILYVNPRGSIGYGQDFVKATHHDWGGGDYEDIMAGVDLVLDQGFVDEERMGVTGLSFGGFMTDWIIGHTDRFRTAVAEVTTSNRYSQWATSDVGYFHGEWEFQGYPWASWENARMYLGRSPLSYVKNVDTPLLILQAQEDHRCPLEQAEQFYRALKVLKKEVQLVIFPGESHVFSRSGKPRHREERLVRISAWFARDLAE